MSQISNNGAEAVLAVFTPLGAGLAAAVATAYAVERFTSLDEAHNLQRDIDLDISTHTDRIQALEETQEILDKEGLSATAIGTAIRDNSQQIAELQTAKAEYGSEFSNTIEFAALPLIMGTAAFIKGVLITRRKLHKKGLYKSKITTQN